MTLSPQILEALTSHVGELVQTEIEKEISAGRLVKASDVITSRDELEDRERRLREIKSEVDKDRDDLVDRFSKLAQGMVGLGQNMKGLVQKGLVVTQGALSYEPSDAQLDSAQAALGESVDRGTIRDVLRKTVRDEIARLAAPPQK